MTRTRTVDTQRQLEYLVDDYVRDGYRVVKDTPTESVVRQNATGNVWIHILLFLATVGIGNAIYLFVKYATADMVRIVVTGAD